MPSYLVTGAARGLGLGFLKVLSGDPQNVVLGLVRNINTAKDLLAAEGINNTNIHLLRGDITDIGSLKNAAAEAWNILGNVGLDVLINNAAYVSEATVLRTLADDEDNLDFEIDDMHKSFDTNVIGVLNTVNSFLPLVRKSKLKKVVTISTAMGDLDFIIQSNIGYASPYSISKAAVNALVAKLGASYGGEGILFISLCPGMVETTAAKNAAKCTSLLGTKAISPVSASLFRNSAPLTNFIDQDADSMARIKDIFDKMGAYSSNLQPPSTPEAAAKNVLKAIERSSLEAGSGGSFLSHNGTKKFM